MFKTSVTARLRRAADRVAPTPARVDAVAALLLALAGALLPAYLPSARGPHADPGSLAAAVGCWLPLAWRRRAPFTAFGTSLASQVCGVLSGRPVPNIVACHAVIYLLAAGRRRRPALICSAVALAAVALAAAAAAGTTAHWQWRLLGVEPVPVAAFACGEAVRARRGHAQTLLARAEAAEHDREEQARRAVTEERLRIARELHDLVAHSMSMIAVQAGSGRVAAPTDPQAAIDALAAVEEGARQTLVEMRRLLGVLRTEESGEDVRRPSPVLAELGELAQRTRAAGLPVRLTVGGRARVLAPALELSVHRIIQEALTNVLRHAPGAAAEVKLAYRSHALDVDVVNTAAAVPPGVTARRPLGHGLIGMTERAALFGGRLTAGRTPDGGFAVRARFPLDAPEPAGAEEDA